MDRDILNFSCSTNLKLKVHSLDLSQPKISQKIDECDNSRSIMNIKTYECMGWRLPAVAGMPAN